MRTEPVFLTDKDGSVILELVTGNYREAECACGCAFHTLEANTSDASGEKHVPVVETRGRSVTVKVGSIFHPMTEEHSIGWVQLHTQEGRCYRACLNPASDPVAQFTLEEGDTPVCVYAYCNLHGLWKSAQ